MNTTPQTVFKFLVGAVIAAAVLFLVWYFSAIVVYILVSAVLAVLGRPLVHYISDLKIKGWKVSRSLAALATLIVIWVVAALFCSLFVPLVFNKINLLTSVDFAAVFNRISEPVSELQRNLQEFFSLPEGAEFSLSDELISTFKQLIDFESINGLFSSVLNIVLSSVIAIFSVSFITFFFLKDEGLFYSMVTSLFPSRYSENITRALDSVTLLLSRYFSGILSESFLLMVAVGGVMMLFGMKMADAAFVGLIMGVMNVVPYAGPLIGGIISVFVGLVNPIHGDVGYTVMVMIPSLLTLKGLDDFILQPALYSERVKAHPLEIFLVILIAGSVAGILGMLLAIPSYTVIRVFAKEFFSQISLVRKLTENI